MSPEQAMGRPVDFRSDIFSFGSLLYEMATGRRPFEQTAVGELLAAVQRDEPMAPRTIDSSIPIAVESLIRRSMHKEPKERLQPMAAVRSALEEIRAGRGNAVESVRSTRWFALAAVVAASGLGIWWVSRDEPIADVNPSVRPLTSLEGFEQEAVVSPDGGQVAFVWSEGEGRPRQVYVQVVDEDEAVPLTSTEAEHRSPTWSHDGRRVYFLREGAERDEIRSVPLVGGVETLVAEVEHLPRHPGLRVEGRDANGLSASPDGETLAYVARGSDGTARIFTLSLKDGTRRQVTSASARNDQCTGFENSAMSVMDELPRFSPTGKELAFVRRAIGDTSSGWLCVQGEDGSPISVTDPFVLYDAAWRDSQSLVLAAGNQLTGSGLHQVSTDGSASEILPFGEGARSVSISRDGARLVFSQWFEDRNIWRASGPTSDVKSRPERVIGSTRDDRMPSVSPSGSQLAFISNRTGNMEVWLADSSGAQPRKLTSLGARNLPELRSRRKPRAVQLDGSP